MAASYNPRQAVQYINRFLFVLALSILAVWIVSELGVRFQADETTARPPQTVELTIPAGTAALVAAGADPFGIPEEMSFVLGDVLLVRNEDEVPHNLGPLFIPAGSSATMPLNEADHFAFTCSFSASRYLGLSVRPPTTLLTRMLGIAFAAPPTAALIFVYSLIVFPIKPKEEIVKGAVANKGG
jgi:hypothetical protein